MSEEPQGAPLSVRATLAVGLAAGILGGTLAGALDAVLVVTTTEGDFRMSLIIPSAIFYALNGVLYVTPLALLIRWVAKLAKRPLRSASALHAWLTAGFMALAAFATASYRISLDVFEERLTWGSPQGIGLLLGCALGGVALAFGLAWVFSRTIEHPRLSFVRKPWGALLLLALVILMVRLTTTYEDEAIAAPAERAPTPTDAARPNVLLIVVDTWRADRLPAYGYAAGSTPALDRFGEDAVRFERFYTNSSWTRPSFATLYTGRYPSSHQVHLKTDALPDEVVTLAETLHGHGYATAGFVTNYNTGPNFNYQQGFDTYHFLEPDLVLGTEHGFGARVPTGAVSQVVGTDIIAMAELLPLRLYQRFFSLISTASDDVSPGTAYHDAETLTGEVLGWLEDAPEAPFFLTVGYMDPHHPFFAHPYDGIGYTRAAHEHPDPEDVPRMRSLYDGEITYWDQQFGVLMDDLRERDLYDDMLIVVTSDHGEEFGEHGGFYHGTTIYEEVVHVPLFVKLPQNQRAGTTVGHWVEEADLMPTILARVGAEIPSGVQGNSLDEGSPFVLTEENHEGHILASLRTEVDGVAWLVITANEDNPRGQRPVELYNVDEDPMQERDLAEREPELTSTLLERLASARLAAAQGAVERSSVELTDEDRDRLRALGYIE